MITKISVGKFVLYGGYCWWKTQALLNQNRPIFCILGSV